MPALKILDARLLLGGLVDRHMPGRDLSKQTWQSNPRARNRPAAVGSCFYASASSAAWSIVVSRARFVPSCGMHSMSAFV